MRKTCIFIAVLMIMSTSCLGLARPHGMGDAFTAVADDLNSVRYNPAGLAFQNGTQLLYDYPCFPLEDQISIYSLSYGGKAGNGFVAFTIDGLDAYDDIFTIHNHTYTLTYALKLYENISLGINLNSITGYMQSSLPLPTDEYRTDGSSADIGLFAKLNEHFSFGIMQNAYCSRNLLYPITMATG